MGCCWGEAVFLGRDGGQMWQRREGYFIYDVGKIEGTIEIVPNI